MASSANNWAAQGASSPEAGLAGGAQTALGNVNMHHALALETVANNQATETFVVCHPYNERATEIGKKHGIEALESLHNLLTPYGWNVGDAPIDEQRANQLYEAAIDRLHKAHYATIREFDHLDQGQRDFCFAEKERLFARQVAIEEICVIERKKIWRKWAMQQRRAVAMANQYWAGKAKNTGQPGMPGQHSMVNTPSSAAELPQRLIDPALRQQTQPPAQAQMTPQMVLEQIMAANKRNLGPASMAHDTPPTTATPPANATPTPAKRSTPRRKAKKTDEEIDWDRIVREEIAAANLPPPKLTLSARAAAGLIEKGAKDRTKREPDAEEGEASVKRPRVEGEDA